MINFSKIKIFHLNIDNPDKCAIMKDIEKGYMMFLNNNDVKERNNKNNPINYMYL